MKKSYRAGVVVLAGMVMAAQAHADTVGIKLSGGGISGTVVVSYGAASDSKYSGQGFEITGVAGTFSDSNIGIANAPITSLVPINHATPLDVPPNTAAPDDFSHFAVATGLPVESSGFITYDNLFWPDGAPATALNFDGAGGFLDIYGLMFTIGGTAAPGTVVDLYNNGVGEFSNIDYGGFGVVVATAGAQLDRVGAGVTATAPEPSTWAMMLLGFVGLGFAGYRKARKTAALAA